MTKKVEDRLKFTAARNIKKLEMRFEREFYLDREDLIPERPLKTNLIAQMEVLEQFNAQLAAALQGEDAQQTQMRPRFQEEPDPGLESEPGVEAEPDVAPPQEVPNG